MKSKLLRYKSSYFTNNKSGRTYHLRIPDVEALHYNPNKTKPHNPNWTID